MQGTWVDSARLGRAICLAEKILYRYRRGDAKCPKWNSSYSGAFQALKFSPTSQYSCNWDESLPKHSLCSGIAADTGLYKSVQFTKGLVISSFCRVYWNTIPFFREISSHLRWALYITRVVLSLLIRLILLHSFCLCLLDTQHLYEHHLCCCWYFTVRTFVQTCKLFKVYLLDQEIFVSFQRLKLIPEFWPLLTIVWMVHADLFLYNLR